MKRYKTLKIAIAVILSIIFYGIFSCITYAEELSESEQAADVLNRLQALSDRIIAIKQKDASIRLGDYLVTTDGWIYEIISENEGAHTYAKIVGYNGSSSDVTIPSVIDLYSVEEISLEGAEIMQNVVIPYGITTLSNNAFSGCTSLKKISIPHSVTTISNNAFTGCTNLSKIICKPGSAAETFAIRNNISTAVIDLKVTYSPTEPTSSYVTVTIEAGETLQGASEWGISYDRKSIYKYYYTNIYENVVVYDTYGYSETVPISVTNIDQAAPTLTVTYTPTVLTNGSVTVKIAADEKMQYVSGWTLAYNKKSMTKEYFHNTSESVTVYDLAGNTSIANINITNIDTTPPVPSVSYSVTSPTSGNVNATIFSNKEMQPVEGWSLTGNKKAMSKTYTQNTSEAVTIMDLAGNTAVCNIYIANIDKNPPMVNVTYDPPTITSGNVTATIVSNEEIQALSGWTLASDRRSMTKTYTNNTQESVYVKDLAGNTVVADVKVSNIDKAAPSVGVTYDPSTPTNGNVTATIFSNEQMEEVSGWDLAQNRMSMTKVFLENTNTAVQVRDLAGNTAVVNVNITNIDKEAPIVNVAYNTTLLTKGPVVVTISANEKLQAISGWSISSDQKSMTKSYSNNTNTAIHVRDLVGNTSIANINISNIDNIAPAISTNYSTTNPTKENVTVTISADEQIQLVEGWNLSSDSRVLTKVYSANTTENITIKDLVGNISTAVVTVNNIDKDAPTATVEYSITALTNETVTVTITANEQIRAVNGWSLSNSNKVLTKTFSDNASENIILTDMVGNETTVNISVTNIDKVAPNATVTYSTTQATSGSVTATITADEELQAIDGWELSEGQKSLSKTYSDNTSENVTIKDLAGNTSIVTISISNIDTSVPLITVTYSTLEPTNGTVTVTATANKMLQAVAGWELSNDQKSLSKTYSENAEEIVTVKDIVNHEMRIIVSVENIDKVAPKLNINNSESHKTNKNVTVTITADERIQPVTGWELSKNQNSLSKTYSENAESTITIKDLAGNESNINVSVTNIDKLAPELSLAYSTTQNTTEDVTVTITANEEVKQVDGWELSNDQKTLNKTYSENAEETITVIDLAGNESNIIVSVTNINKTVLKGDSNIDGKVTVTDLLVAKRFIVGINKVDSDILKFIDMNEDNKYTVTDLLLLKRKLVGL